MLAGRDPHSEREVGADGGIKERDDRLEHPAEAVLALFLEVWPLIASAGRGRNLASLASSGHRQTSATCLIGSSSSNSAKRTGFVACQAWGAAFALG